jgi:hypothetical protein
VKAVDSELGNAKVEASPLPWSEEAEEGAAGPTAGGGCCGLSGETGGVGSGCVLSSADCACGASEGDDSATTNSTQLSPLCPATPAPVRSAAAAAAAALSVCCCLCRLPSASASSLLSAPLLTETEAAGVQASEDLRLREGRSRCWLLANGSGAWRAIVSCTETRDGGGREGRY